MRDETLTVHDADGSPLDLAQVDGHQATCREGRHAPGCVHEPHCPDGPGCGCALPWPGGADG